MVYGINSSKTSANHVAIVTGYTSGDAGPNVVNGDFNYTVEAVNDETNGFANSNDASDLGGYTSP